MLRFGLWWASAMCDFPARLLHRLALGNPVVLEVNFALERRFFAARSPVSVAVPHVFVSGLARSGTTVLMRALYDSMEFSVLTYRDMPFVLAPNTWAKIAAGSRPQMGEVERAHGDGLRIGFDSPEALEEVFWWVFGGNYIRKDRLVSVLLADESIVAFRVYIDLINRRYNKKRYLSKNNNLLRLTALLRAFPRRQAAPTGKYRVSAAGREFSRK